MLALRRSYPSVPPRCSMLVLTPKEKLACEVVPPPLDLVYAHRFPSNPPQEGYSSRSPGVCVNSAADSEGVPVRWASGLGSLGAGRRRWKHDTVAIRMREVNNERQRKSSPPFSIPSSRSRVSAPCTNFEFATTTTIPRRCRIPLFFPALLVSESCPSPPRFNAPHHHSDIHLPSRSQPNPSPASPLDLDFNPSTFYILRLLPTPPPSAN
ncbi:hypothetical protein GALMADRAFT_160466 [Galerina marginata CBS 339.88]|uniref:Uncharacterized protein n=1 Tax=Galerina marginata (strain CBS 339.88) TaxID=685588 RepID=A0A067SF17_GALM3|nr:hypothetical protein GALMADRAFT_160466 [Galerina marginata CBS 339.88]